MTKYQRFFSTIYFVKIKDNKAGDTMNKSDFTLQSIELKDKKVFRDTIHNYIHVDHTLILDLINSAAMQRLKRIKQLGGIYQVYPGAEHSRFTHSLGVYAIVYRMLKESVVKDYLNDYQQLTVMVAGLLHDIGHGPFSHCFEHIFHHHHEQYTAKIIRQDPEIYWLLENCVTGLSEDVCAVIEKKHPDSILIQMISSQLDCDRMDYLLRDSYFTGTTYGHFDLARLLRIMAVRSGKIVYKQSGVQAIENYILARYHMYWQVYYHPTTRCYEQILIALFKRMQDLYNQGQLVDDVTYFVPFLKGNMSVADYLQLDENICFYYIRTLCNSQDAILKDLAYRFLNRKLFVYEDYRDLKQKQEIEKLCLDHGFDPRYYVFVDDQMQIPYLHYGHSDDIREIQIITERGLVSLSTVSEIVGAIIHSKKNKVDSKIYYPQII